VLTTYETLRDLEFSFAAEKWSIMICDEAQRIKNPNAMVTRAAKKQNAIFRVACTGTPVENTLADLWCLFDYVQPGLLGALNDFGRRYRRPIEAETEEEQARVNELRERISPHAFAVDRVVALDPEPAAHPPRPLSVDAESTAWALAVGVAYIGLFWCARAIFSIGGLRTTVRGVAWLGLTLTALVAVQRATSPALLYWTWTPLSVGASPYGPFVNRNALASWLAMAVPLVIGYAIARHQSLQRSDGGVIPGASLDPTQLWLAGAAVMMTGGLLASMSRGGVFGGGVGLIAFIVFSRKRIAGGRSVAWMIAGLVALVAAASLYANLGQFLMRLQETTEQGTWGRPAIWRDTWRMASDFPLAGVGAGAFQRGMLAYQEGSRLFFFNHAHNEYLQIVAEGGALIAVPPHFLSGAYRADQARRAAEFCRGMAGSLEDRFRAVFSRSGLQRGVSREDYRGAAM
jgi:hypothetical protein